MKIPRVLPALAIVALAVGCGGRRGVDSAEWTAMGTIARLSFKGGDAPVRRAACELVRSLYGEIEEKLSIWRPGSEVSLYTSLDGVSSRTRPCYEAAFALRERSEGAFNPFWRGAGKGPDLGGIAKGFAVDLAAEALSAGTQGWRMPEGCAVLVDLGGNLKVVSGEWRTGIRDPSGGDGVVEIITLTNGMACATSGEYMRGKHIRDGRTGLPLSNDVASVTVVHPSSAMLADGLSTTLFVLGREKGDEFLLKWHPEAFAIWVMKTGPAAGSRRIAPDER